MMASARVVVVAEEGGLVDEAARRLSGPGSCGERRSAAAIDTTVFSKTWVLMAERLSVTVPMPQHWM
jgi:hypothetical protein